MAMQAFLNRAAGRVEITLAPIADPGLNRPVRGGIANKENYETTYSYGTAALRL
jgi:hypothetical protein